MSLPVVSFDGLLPSAPLVARRRTEYTYLWQTPRVEGWTKVGMTLLSHVAVHENETRCGSAE